MRSWKYAACASAAAVLSIAAGLASASAADYPNAPVTFLVPYAAGGNGDTVSRILATNLQKQLGQPVVIDNRPGAGGSIGAVAAAKEAADGYTIFLATNTHVFNMLLYDNPGFDLAKDFDPVSTISTATMVLTGSMSSGKSLSDLIAAAKAQPGSLDYFSAGNGTTGHVLMELFKQEAGVDIQHIPYQGFPPALTDLIAARVDTGFANVSTANELIKSGQIRGYAVASSTRSPALPDVPTFTELGVAGMEAPTWQGIMVPKGTPPEIVAKLNSAISASLADPTVRAEFEAQGITAAGSTPEEFRTLIDNEVKRWAAVIKQANIKME